jgi:UDP-galactopyranose mutase
VNTDVLIVGAGFAGCVIAERLANAGRRVLVIDRRNHVGGNAYDCFDDHGVLIHPYGPHLFHTNARRIFDYLSRFTQWRPYEHRVLAKVGEQLLPIPINRTTINRLYGLTLREDEMETYFASVRVKRDPIRTSEDVVLNSVGHDLCEKFFRGYTYKQWGLDLSQLSAGVAARIPTRSNDDDRYFADEYQAMPQNGYSSLFNNLLKHANIRVELGAEFRELRKACSRHHTVYTGRIDEYFDYSLGMLPYRSLRFEHEHIPNCEFIQPVATVNFPNDHAYTRCTEFKHTTGQVHSGTSIVREYPQAQGEPYYPIPRPENEARFKQYEKLAAAEVGVTFVGRLAQYRYYNMDQVVGAALKAAENILAAPSPGPVMNEQIAAGYA